MKAPAPASPPSVQFQWTRGIAPDQWQCYRRAMRALRAARVPFLLGGGFALAAYTGRWRNTKDIDFYIFRDDRDAAVRALAGAGFQDYYPQLAYDRKWIYRSTCAGVIVDIIWAMANQRAQVDDLWFQNARAISIRNEPLRLVPIEEFIWCKLYILQRDHCDWTDVWNVLYSAGSHVDWAHLLRRLDEDWPLLKAMLVVFGWLCPKRYRRLPQWLKDILNLQQPGIPAHHSRNHIRLLDSRDWFVALLPKRKPLLV